MIKFINLDNLIKNNESDNIFVTRPTGNFSIISFTEPEDIQTEYNSERNRIVYMTLGIGKMRIKHTFIIAKTV